MSAARTIKALLTLATQLFKTLVLRALLPIRGPGRWLEALRREQLGPSPAGSWELFQGASSCIACGACDAVGTGDEAPSQWVMAAARRPADAPLERGRAAQLRQVAAHVSKICPSGVSVEAIAALIERSAAARQPSPDAGNSAIGRETP